MTEKKEDFLRLSGDSDFQNRSESIFGRLDKLEPEQNTETSETEISRPRPLGPRAPKRVPDHVLHPAKWTKYSLEDDGSDKHAGMTGDALNRHAALSFMDEIRKRKENPCKTSESESDIEMAEKHVFSKSSIKHKMDVDEVPTRSHIMEGVHVMPEYVIGQSTAKTPKKQQQVPPADNTPGDVVCLDHLEQQETIDSASESTKQASDSVGEQKEGATFTKRKVKSRGRLRERKSSEDDE